MRVPLRAAVVGVLVIGSALVTAAAPAAGRTTGKASFRGQIVAPAQGGQRTVASSIIVFRGVLNGVGRIVEVPNRRGDPDSVSRDNLVFARGSMHLLSTNVGAPRFAIDPMTCVATGRIKQTGKIQGGTGRFRRASGTFKGTVRVWAVAARNPDGSCSQQADALLDADIISGHGTLSY